MVDIAFDTSVLFYPTKLRRLALRPDVRIWASTTNVIETVSDVVDEISFRKARSQFALMLEVSGKRFLPDTDTQFKMYLGYPGVIDDPMEWRQIAVMIARAANLSDLAHIDFERAREMRARHTSGWVNDVINDMLLSINPDLKTTPDWNSRASAEVIEKLRNFLHSPSGRKTQLDTWFRRERWNPVLVSPDLYRAALPILMAYFQAHEGFLVDILLNGRKPEANDALDLDQVLPLWQEGWMLVSADRRLIRNLELGGMSRSKFAVIQDLDPGSNLLTEVS